MDSAAPLASRRVDRLSLLSTGRRTYVSWIRERCWRPPSESTGSFAAAGRYSYTGALLSIFSSSLTLGYWDYQARVTNQT